MLYEICCDKFLINKGKENEAIRGPIRFKDGLNVVLGENSAKNSIGKSSFLLAIDFVFGGEDYVKPDNKITPFVGEHTIEFCFKFNDTLYYFSRVASTDQEEKSIVYKCNENYVPIEKMKLADFRAFLLNQYSIKLPQATFRGIVNLFFRIWGRDTVKDVQQPLMNDVREKVEESLIKFLKLYNLYTPIIENKKLRDEKENYKDAVLKAKNNKVIKLITKTGYASNCNKLEELQIQLDELTTRGSIEITTIDENITQQALELKSEYDILNKQKRVLWAKWWAIDKAEKYRRPATQEDFNELLKYFPNSNVNGISEIESFHKQLSSILANEFKKGKAAISSEVNEISSEMANIEQQMREINLPQQISKRTLKTCGEIYSQMTRLQNENALYLENEKVAAELKNAMQIYTKIFLEQYMLLEKQLNNNLSSLNSYIYGNSRSAPVLSVSAITSYKYDTARDGGTGISYKDLILLDLATLELTALPVLIHDTIIFKNIDQPAMGKIIELYNNQLSKQIFIAFDATVNYPETAQEIIKSRKVIELSSGGNELFGFSWSDNSNNQQEVLNGNII